MNVSYYQKINTHFVWIWGL